MKLEKKTLLPLAVGAAVFTLGFFAMSAAGTGNSPTEGGAQRRATGPIVETVAVTLAERSYTIEAPGRLQSWEELTVVAEVSGKIIYVNPKFTLGGRLPKGELLFKIDPADYQLAVDNAATNLELAGQEIGASTASVATAQAKVVEAKANVDHIKAQSRRVYELEKKQIYSVARGDKARAAVIKSQAQLDSARSELEKAKQALGVQGKENPKIRSAIAKLKKAQIDLS
ncbi:MAG: hypothetical protein JKY60_05630, partial [Kordiimonadaceae bacterium]|nr:hypothetical protein [Kordiimonadaceae bacterium]